MAELNIVLDQFQKDLQRIRHLLRLVQEFRNFAASSVPGEVASGATPWPEAQELFSVGPDVRTDLPTLSGSLLLYLCGQFENFVREVVVSLADDVAGKVSKYGELPEKLRKELQSKTAEVAQNPKRYGYTPIQAEQFIIELGKNLDGNHSPSGVVIRSEFLSITESNMNSQTLTEVCKRVAFDDIWVNAGKQAKLKTFLNKPDDRECANEAKNTLDEIMKERNKIAHPNGTIVFPGPEKVLERVEYLDVIAQIIVDLAKVPR